MEGRTEVLTAVEQPPDRANYPSPRRRPAEEPARCESHHVVAWAKPGEGPADIDNLALLCGTCHRRLHNHKRVLTRSPDGTWGTAPDPRHAGRQKHPAPHRADTAAGSGARARASGAAAPRPRPITPL